MLNLWLWFFNPLKKLGSTKTKLFIAACAILELGVGAQSAGTSDVDRLILQKNFAQVESLSTLSNTRQRAYAKAEIALVKGDAAQTVLITKILLNAEPKSVAVRYLLVRALLAQRKEIEAAQIAQQADIRRLPPTVAKQYAALIAEARKARSQKQNASTTKTTRKSDRKSGLLFSMNVAPTTNVTGGTSSQTIVIGGLPFKSDTVAKEGVSVAGNLEAFHTIDVEQNLSLRLGASLGLKVNSVDTKAYETTTGVSASLQWKTSHGSMALGPIADHMWVGHQSELWRYGVRYSVSHNFTSGSELYLSGRAVVQDYTIRDFRDGWRANLDANYSFSPNPDYRVDLTVGTEIERTELKHLDYFGYYLGIDVVRKFEWAGSLYVGAGLNWRDRSYVGNAPLSSEPRHDETLTASLTFAHNKIKFFNFTPKVIVEYTQTNSNLALYTSNAATVRFAANRSF